MFIVRQLTKTNLHYFVSNAYLLVDINEIETLNLIKDCLNNLNDNEQLKVIMNCLFIKATELNARRQGFNMVAFQTKHLVPMTLMCLKEHGKPYKTKEDMIRFGVETRLDDIMNDV